MTPFISPLSVLLVIRLPLDSVDAIFFNKPTFSVLLVLVSEMSHAKVSTTSRTNYQFGDGL